jgi:hypothetical protein
MPEALVDVHIPTIHYWEHDIAGNHLVSSYLQNMNTFQPGKTVSNYIILVLNIHSLQDPSLRKNIIRSVCLEANSDARSGYIR